MAINKQTFSVDFVKGTDTKTNELITENFKDMVNVVFNGDMTAHKMPGYNQSSTLSDSVETSILFRRKNDVITQTSKASYKYLPQSDSFIKISDMGSAELENTESFGEFFAAGANYNCYYKTTWDGRFTAFYSVSAPIYGNWTFTDKNNNVINTVQLPLGTVSNCVDIADKFTKIISAGDCFYFIGATLDGLTLGIKAFSLSGGQFTLSDGYDFATLEGHQNTSFGSGSSCLNTVDMITDGTSVFLALQASSGNNILKFAADGSIAPTIVAISPASDANLELFNYDSNYFLMSIASESGTTSTLKLRKYSKTSLTFSTETTITNASFDTGTTVSKCLWACYPTSDTTAVVYNYLISRTDALYLSNGNPTGYYQVPKSNSILNTNNFDGLIPMSKIFNHNGKYYAHFLQSLGESATNLIVDIQTGAPRAVFGLYDVDIIFNNIIQKRLSSYFSGTSNLFPGYFTTQEVYNDNGLVFCSSTNFYDGNAGYKETYRATLNFQTTKNSSIEVAGKSFISGSVPQYFDGVSLTEHDLIGAPYIQQSGVGTGSLKADSVYQVLAIYSWKDSSGVEFVSRFSNILGGNVNGSPIVITAGQSIGVDVYVPLATVRSNIICEVYIKASTDTEFQLASSFKTNVVGLSGRYSLTISSNPAPVSKPLYTINTGTVASQIEHFPAMSIKSMALYQDCIFYIKNGDNNNIYTSIQKTPTESFAFKETSLYLSCLDKRGVNEDSLEALQAMDGRLFIFKANSILYTTGDAPADNGSTSGLISPQLLTTDVGCISNRSIILMPNGIMFMSDKGIYLLDRKLQVSYIGAPVERFNSNSVTSATLLESKNEIRFTMSSSIVLVFNYLFSQWSWFSNIDAVGAVINQGKFTALSSNGYLLTETSSHNKLGTIAISQKISSPWIRGNGKEWWQKVYDLTIVGKYKSEHQIKVDFFYDYETYADTSYILDPLSSSNYNINTKPNPSDIESGAMVDGVFQIQIDIPRKNCQAFRFEISDIPVNYASNSGECFSLSSYQIVFGVKNGPAKIPNVKTY